MKRPDCSGAAQAMLRMRIVRGPLRTEENETILREYNRLTGSAIPLREFVHWVQNSPAGPAWHALLETDEGRIVGHTSAFPLRTGYSETDLTPAKSEYSFLHEDFRKKKIQGHETVSRPPFVILLDHFFRTCQKQGWGPIFVSTNDKNQLIGRKVGLRPTEFPLWECLLILRPACAAKETPNLTAKQRAALFAAGMAQGGLWRLLGKLPEAERVRIVPVGVAESRPERDRISFFDDEASLNWRYLDGQYVRFGFSGAKEDHLIAKRGSGSRYLRVCQWNLNSSKSVFPLVTEVVREAMAEQAMGVRWGVYRDGEAAEQLVWQLRRAGFACARRTRILMVHKKDEKFLQPSSWKMNDSLFSFDP